jgi:peptide/nickel transport system permease protein
MLTLIGRRVALAAFTLLLVSAVVFTLASLLPGDAAEEAMGQGATPETVAALRTALGLDQPAPQRYWNWLSGLVSGDLGHSLVNQLPVSELLQSRLPNSLLLAGLTALVAVPLAIAIGILAAVRRDSLLDRALNVGTLSMLAVPEFLVATIAVLIFAVELQWLPALSAPPAEVTPLQLLRNFALPVLTLSAVIIAQMARMTRAALIDQLDAPYIEMARLKGVAPARVVWRHAIPNAVGPIANAIAFSLSALLGGAIIVETIFNYPGVASLMVDAVTSRDTPLLQACAMVFCVAYLSLVLLADICAILANPRLRRA